MIPDSTLEEIKERISIIDVIGEYIELKKSGTGFSGLCPFHKEKTPSFHVHPVKQFFHCFGCHKGGNVYTFLSAIEGISFPEAVEKLANRAGIEIKQANPNQRFQREPQISDSKKRLFAALEWAAKYFTYLLNDVGEYKHAKEYITNRGLSQKTLDRFKIGVSPTGWSTLRDLLLNRGYSLNELIQAGLVVESDKGGYDRFRERLMFPIRDKEGRVIGFGARLLKEEENQPKYLNSSESSIFTKRKFLYGEYENQREIRTRGETIIVEGYMDVVGLFEKGVCNSVATMGTALTEDHVRALRKLTNRVITVFDPDAAGREASERSIELFLNGGLLAKDLTLPDGKDPDDFVKECGAEKFYKLCEKSPRQITKLFKEIAEKGSLSEEEKAKVLDRLTPILIATRKLPDRATLWDSLHLILNVSVSVLKELSEPQGSAKKKTPLAAPEPAGHPRRRAAHHPPGPKKKDILDFQFFKMALRCENDFRLLPKAQWEGALREAELREKLVHFHSCEAGKQKDIVLGWLHSETDPELQSVFSGFLTENQPEMTPQEREFFEALARQVLNRAKENDIHQLSKQVKLAQQMGDEQEQLRLLRRLKELRSGN